MAHWVFRYRGALAYLSVVFALFWVRGQTQAPWLTWPLGCAVLTAGVAVRVAAQSHLHHRLKMQLELTTSGPYGLVRNPLYIGNTLICTSAAVLGKLLWLAPLAFLWCVVVYAVVVRSEEERLLNLYGEPYHRYLAEVPRWLPRGRTVSGNLFARPYVGKAILAELHSFLIVPLFLLKDLLHSLLHRWL